MIAKYLFENDRLAIKKAKHGHFLYNRYDAFISRSLDHYGEWCEAEIELLGRLIVPGDTVLDIGANIGSHTLAFANLVGPQGRVHAFEPQRHVFHLLCANVALNMKENVVCHPKAVGARPGRIAAPVLPQNKPSNFGAVRLGAAGGAAAVEEIELTTVDALNLASCRLIKVDVEGMEADVLAGADETLARCAPFLFVECNKAETAPAVIDALLSRGYRAWWHIENYYNPANFYGNPENVFHSYVPEQNLFCAPRASGFDLRGAPECLGPDDSWQSALQRLKASS